MKNKNRFVDIVRTGDREYSVKCYQCGREFEATRPDASFCSVNCRMAHHREPLRRAALIEHLRIVGLTVRDASKKYSRNQEIFNAVLALAKEVNAALEQFENE